MNGLTKIESLEKEVSNLRVDLVHANQESSQLRQELRECEDAHSELSKMMAYVDCKLGRTSEHSIAETADSVSLRIKQLEALLRRAHPNMHTTDTTQWFTDRDAVLAGSNPSEVPNSYGGSFGIHSVGLPNWEKGSVTPDPRDKRIKELEGSCAVMRETIEFVGCRVEHPDDSKLPGCEVCERIDKALSSDAGKSIIVRLHSLESSHGELVKVLEHALFYGVDAAWMSSARRIVAIATPYLNKGGV